MLSFHNDPAVKQKYLDRIIKHREMDNIIQGKGWENGKGCAVGCTLENYNHARYPIELGIPKWLAYLEDSIFEGLTIEKAKLWPELFLKSIPVGVNLEPLKYHLNIKRMDRLLVIMNGLLGKGNDEVINQTINAIKMVKECNQLHLDNKPCNWDAAEEIARAVAGAAAYSAAWAATSAGAAAYSAAWAATSAAAWESWSAARSAAWAATWQQEADDLIELLTNKEIFK